MQSKAWQSLFALESADAVFRWHKQIHSRGLSARRQKEIISSAKQAREFFRNSYHSNDSVKPLLSFYGVASLSRALCLLLRPGSGEEALAKGHGLETVGWTEVLSSEISESIAALGSLKIKTCSGLFTDFLRETDNRICVHIRSSAVDWRLNYEIPPLADEMALDDLLSRIPDLQQQYTEAERAINYTRVQDMSSSPDTGLLNIKVEAKQFTTFKDAYVNAGFTVSLAGEFYDVACSTDVMARFRPQFMHTYVNKIFGSIPKLNLVKPMQSGARYSQMAVTYLTSYILGMLTRYFPTHWASLMNGEKGDVLWPSINAAQHYIDSAFPEMVVSFIHDTLTQRGLKG